MVRKRKLDGERKESTTGLGLLNKDSPDKFRGLNTVEHLQQYYSPYLKAYGAKENLISQYDMRNYDRRLFVSISGLCYRSGEKLRDVIPPKTKVRDREKIAEDRQSLKVEIGGVKYDFSEDNPSDEEIDKVIYTLISLKGRRK